MLSTRLKSGCKTALLKSRLHVLLKPLRRIGVYLACLSEVMDWCLAAWRANPRAVLRTRNELYEFVHAESVRDEPIDYLEFGVWTGNSFKWWLARNTNPQSRFVGFDTFTGLPEDWGYYKKQHFDTAGAFPDVTDPRAEFVAGLFQDTLGPFLKQHEFSRRKVINIDADLYSSTLFVLASLAPHLRPGDVLIFDEFLAWRTPTDQFRALRDFSTAFYVDYTFLGAARHFEKVAIEIAAR